ncbi:hypothetical protein F5Y04DRAFT_171706 [Hypomontagnella monticulosa]|nr:hypothetical protein F5Y04DRAFT_171706 [Hypomontagnella monticulosa]
MALRSLLALAALAVVPSYAQNQTTWVVTSFITEIYKSSSTVKYDSAPVTPVKRSTTLDIVTEYTTEAPSSQDRTVTHWLTEQVTFPVSTYTAAYTTTLSTPLKVTSNGTSTIVAWVSPTLATVTLSPTACADSEPPSKTVTEYTGTYSPFPGQVTTTPASYPVAATTYVTLTASYRVLTQVGSTVTVTSTATGFNWLSTTTVSSDKTFTVAPFKYTSTVYLNTVTTTSSDYQLGYTTAAATPCPETPTVTRAAQCAPSNLIAERDGHGAAVQLLPRDWAFPIGFPSTLIGVPGMDASACCQLCLDNEGCAASEWTIEWSGACRLYYYVHGNDTCGADTTLEYYGDTYAFPRQASFVQAGCGKLKYYGLKNPFCPDCEVDE